MEAGNDFLPFFYLGQGPGGERHAADLAGPVRDAGDDQTVSVGLAKAGVLLEKGGGELFREGGLFHFQTANA